jgi:O-antigen/teichoic acid export membrane protein
MSLQVPLAGLVGVQGGILRRLGRIHAFAVITVLGATLGVSVGLLVTFHWPSATALVVQPIISAMTMTILAVPLLGRRTLPGRVRRTSLADLAFSLRAGYAGLLAYFFFSLPQWAMSVTMGPLTFANWNRAVTVGQVPVDLVGRSIATVVYPRFRDHSATTTVRAMWTGMLATSALVVFPLCGVVLPIVPDIVRIAIGAQWAEAQSMAPWVVAAAVVGLQGSLLANALESSGQFRAVWFGQYAVAPVLVAGSILVLIYGSWLPAAISFLLAAIIAHSTQVFMAARLRLISGGPIVRRYCASVSIGVALIAESLLVRSHVSPALATLNAAAVCALYLLVLNRFKDGLALVPSTWVKSFQ